MSERCKGAGGVLAILMLVAVAGCNTMAGMGKDMEAAGNSLSHAFEKTPSEKTPSGESQPPATTTVRPEQPSASSPPQRLTPSPSQQ